MPSEETQTYHYIVGWDEQQHCWVASVVEEPTLRALAPTAARAVRKLLVDLQDVLGPLKAADATCEEPDLFSDCT